MSLLTKRKTNTVPSPFRIIKQGYLKKEGSVVKSWKDRYFVLKVDETNRSGCLLYYKSDKKKDEGALPLGGIDLQDVAHVAIETSKPGTICIYSTQRNLIIQAESDAARDDWYNELQDALHNTCNPSDPEHLNIRNPGNAIMFKKEALMVRLKMTKPKTLFASPAQASVAEDFMNDFQ